MNHDQLTQGKPGLIQVPSRRHFLTRSAMLTVAGSASAILTGSTLAATTAAEKEEKREVPSSSHDNAKADFRDIQAHENAHVAFLVAALGANARPKPTFTGLLQKSFADFVTVSQALENTGVGVYLGAAPYINNPAILAAAGSILAIEARHSGFLNTFLRDPITGNSIDDDSDPNVETALTADQVDADAGPFIADLNGGPAVTYDTTRSDANDIAILNFALALEYLEAEFYNLNVPKFYRH